MNVALIDGAGCNIGSLCYALRRLGVEAELTVDGATIQRADHVILPGVGAAGPAMARLDELGLIDIVRGLSQPVLGICLGMQLLCSHSEEGNVDCLGLIEAPVRRFGNGNGLRVPQMGWNKLEYRADHPLLQGLDGDEWAYFVHSYAVPVGEWTLAGADHGGEFSAVIGRRNFFGMQFHPERSANVGARLLRNFLAL